MVGIKKNEISKAFSLCSPLETGYYQQVKKIHFISFLPVYFHLTGLSESTLPDVIELANEILNKDKSLKSELPQIVAASLLIYYMDINGVTCDLNFSLTVGKSEITLNNMKKRIEIIHNS